MAHLKEESAGATDRKAWHSPRLEELGNLRDFVQSGNAYGKSIQTTDGESMAGNESNPHMNP